jgi:hypothetical protein
MPTTTIDNYTVVVGYPSSLADAAGLDLDTYSLARMIASEDGSANDTVLRCLGECARNQAAHNGVSITTLLTKSSDTAINGLYSEQAAGKWASTRVDPDDRATTAAQDVIAGSSYAKGGRDFFDPSSQDKGVQNGHILNLTSEKYIDRNASSGLYWVGPIDGVDPYHLMIFADGADTSTTAALAALNTGRGFPASYGNIDSADNASAPSSDSSGGIGIGALFLLGLAVILAGGHNG